MNQRQEHKQDAHCSLRISSKRRGVVVDAFDGQRSQWQSPPFNDRAEASGWLLAEAVRLKAGRPEPLRGPYARIIEGEHGAGWAVEFMEREEAARVGYRAGPFGTRAAALAWLNRNAIEVSS